MSEPTFSLGIDLGTSNSACALQRLDQPAPELLPIPQVTAPNQIGAQSTLPSALYLPVAEEEPSLRTAWHDAALEPPGVIGQYARNQGALVPDRLVTSAKSWLSNLHVDPRSDVLPWGSDGIEKISAFETSRRYLDHIRQAALAAGHDPAQASVVVTVPASFEEGARNLTLEAAREAGFGEVILLEEPQAAFYAWIAHTTGDWRKQVEPGEIVLVCDVGGGTADFSLILVTEQSGELQLERISVGEHLLLGGDNMDLALAHTLNAQYEESGKSLDHWQFLALIHACSRAKVELFAHPDLDRIQVAVPSRGSSLFAKTVSLELERALLEAIVLDGFLPMTAPDELPADSGGVGLQELGLPYASDPVISKHLARFLTRSLLNVQASDELRARVGKKRDLESAALLMPDRILFNGGVFNAAPVRQRVLDLLASWAGRPVHELAGAQPDLAVAQGAAIYGRNRATGEGLRIKAGTARSYYIGLQTSMPAVPGFKPPIKALCVVPQGMEEGSEWVLENQEFGLVTGKPVDFRFFSSAVRSGDEAGQVIPNALKSLEESGQLEITLPPADGFPEGQAIPVQINPVVTELGNLELWMKHRASGQRWKVEFQVRME